MNRLLCRILGHRWLPTKLAVLSEWPLHESYAEAHCYRCGKVDR